MYIYVSVNECECVQVCATNAFLKVRLLLNMEMITYVNDQLLTDSLLCLPTVYGLTTFNAG